MKTDPNSLIDTYLDWFKSYSSGLDLGDGWSELTLPYIDQHNDFLQVYIRTDEDGLHITDEGRTIRELSHVGCELKNKNKRRELAEIILRSRGFNPSVIDSGEIVTKAVSGEFPRRLHSILMSMLAIGGLATTSPSNVSTLFMDDVADWLDSQNFEFETRYNLKGKSENVYEFDFLIPGSGVQPDQIIQTFNKPDSTQIESFAYRVIDSTEGVKDQVPKFFAVFSETTPFNLKNNRNLLSRGIDPWEWKKREEFARKLSRVA